MFSCLPADFTFLTLSEWSSTTVNNGSGNANGYGRQFVEHAIKSEMTKATRELMGAVGTPSLAV